MTEDRKEELSMRLECLRMANMLQRPISYAQDMYDFLQGKKFKNKKERVLKTQDGLEVPIHSSETVQ